MDLSSENYNQIDFLCSSPHKSLGGSETTGVLIGKISSYDSSLPPSFPGGGTVKYVTKASMNSISYNSEIFSREMPGTPNTIGFYRAALSFEL